MNRTIKTLLATTTLLVSAAPIMAQDAATVFFLLPNSTTIRFESRDAPFFVEAMAEYAPGVEVIVQNGEGDPARQQRLMEDAIAQGADVILYTSSDANLSAGSLAAAEAANVPVVLYDHDAIGGRAEAHVVFDSLSVGQAQGQRAAELIAAMPEGTIRVARVKGNQGEYGTSQYEAGQDEFLDPLIASGKRGDRLRAIHPELGSSFGAILRRRLPYPYRRRSRHVPWHERRHHRRLGRSVDQPGL
jgi:D-xylose transport system substrate-binding protein